MVLWVGVGFFMLSIILILAILICKRKQCCLFRPSDGIEMHKIAHDPKATELGLQLDDLKSFDKDIAMGLPVS